MTSGAATRRGETPNHRNLKFSATNKFDLTEGTIMIREIRLHAATGIAMLIGVGCVSGISAPDVNSRTAQIYGFAVTKPDTMSDPTFHYVLSSSATFTKSELDA